MKAKSLHEWGRAKARERYAPGGAVKHLARPLTDEEEGKKLGSDVLAEELHKREEVMKEPETDEDYAVREWRTDDENDPPFHHHKSQDI